MAMRFILSIVLYLTALPLVANVTLGDPERVIHDVAIQDSLLAAVTDHRLEIWDLVTLKLVKAVDYADDAVLSAVSFGNGFTQVITGDRNGNVVVWDLESGSQAKIRPGDRHPVTMVDVRQEANLAAIASANHRLLVYDLSSGALVFEDSVFTSDVTSVKFIKHRAELAAGSADGRVVVYSLDKFRTVSTLQMDGWVIAVSEGKDSTQLAVADDRGRLHFFSAQVPGRLDELSSISHFTDRVVSVDHAGRSIAYATLSGRVIVVTPFGRYTKRTSSLITRIRLFESNGKYLTIVYATQGKGIQLLKAKDMKMN